MYYLMKNKLPQKWLPSVCRLLQITIIAFAIVPESHAALGASDFLKTDGKFIKNNSGTGSIVSLRGTNIGGWLPFEDWMSPLGEFAADRTGWTASASVNSGSAGNAIDGDYSTRWTPSAVQSSGRWFQVDMGGSRLISRVYIDAGGFTDDYPVGYQVLVSTNGTTWKDAASGSGSLQNTIVRFTPQVAQYVRLVQTGSSGTDWWSLAEFNVFTDHALHNGGSSGTASSTGWGFATANALDGDVDTRWSSGTAMAPGQWFEIDLGQSRDVSGLIVDSGALSAGDYMRGYEVLGWDGFAWTKYVSGSSTERITRIELPWSFGMSKIRLVQTGTSANWWSIGDVAVVTDGALDRTGWTVTASSTEAGGSVNNLMNGNLSSRWSTGLTQASGQWLEVDLGAEITINQVVLNTAKNSGDEQDYPRSYKLSVSTNGSTWTQAVTGEGGRKATPINFEAVNTRYVRIELTASSGAWWSVGELTASLNNDHFSMNSTYVQRFGTTIADGLVDDHQDTWLVESDLDKLQSLGINCIRLPIAWNTLLNLDGTWRSSPWTKIDWLIDEAGDRDMYVLLDLHTVPGGGAPWGSAGRIGPNPNAFWTTPTYQAWVIDIWEEIAARYEGNPAVAGYDLINEPLLDYGEDTDDIADKSMYYDELYDAVRAIDADHTIHMAAFFGWDKIAMPGTMGWTNVVYELHPYDMPGMSDWTRMNAAVEQQLAEVGPKLEDPNWNVPVLYGEYCWSLYDDVWAKFMNGMNALNVSWTSWSYKVTRPMFKGGGGYWGFYNSNANPVPIINSDSAADITAKLGEFATSDFVENEKMVAVISRFSENQHWMATVPLDQTGWTATASVTEGGSAASNALDWNTGTRWSAGTPQAANQWFQVNLGAKTVFDQVSFETAAADTWDYPREREIQVSQDGSSWTTVSDGEGWGWKEAVVFAPQFAQYVRVLQTGTAHEWWTMSEFHVFAEPALARTGRTASASVTESGSAASNALDPSASTRWRNGLAQASGQYYEVDLGLSETFNRVSMDAGTSTTEYPRAFDVQVSDDGSSWITVASATAANGSTVVEFPVQYARYVRVALTASSASWWSIHDFNIYGELERSRTGWTGTASSTELGGATAHALDGNTANRWSLGANQATGQWYKADMGSNQWINHLVMDSGTNTNDYARGYIVEVSTDDTNWQIVANGEGTSTVIAVNFPIVETRYVRVTLKKASANWWSISEFRFFE